MRKCVSAILIMFGACSSYATTLFIDNPQTLAQLENQGFDLARLVFNEAAAIPHNELLVKNSAYAVMVKSLGTDLEELKKEDPKLFISMKGSHRLFDPQWLISNYAAYELVGVVNRMDRLSFKADSCGEIRFIYRLSYKTLTQPAVYSRLPMTINSVFLASKSHNDDCGTVLKKWNEFITETEKGHIAGLSKKNLPLGDLKSIEINMQSVRWPSTIRPDMAGYAEYMLRVFTFQGGKLSLSSLENTPDIKKISADKKLRNELLIWLNDKKNLKNIDDGIVVIPEKFLATRATSVALHGTHRLHNANFSQLFKTQDFSEAELKEYSSFKTPAGLLRRLNDMSCMGCHQGRTVAGFHFLGKDKSATDAVNSIFTSSSPHFILDQKRRSLFAEAIQKKTNLPHARPLSVRAADGEGKMGSHCGLGDPSFATWTCGEGFECQSMTSDKLISPTGICVAKNKISGSPCTSGQMVHHINSKKDRLKLNADLSCGDNYVCEDVSVGFPNGMCAGSCSQLKADETCGSIAVLHEFNTCLAEGKLSFAKCLGENIRPASMQECDSDKFCRDDYICARTSQGKGSCIPPYFLFQLRVDGHPSPGLAKEKFTFIDRLKKLLPD